MRTSVTLLVLLAGLAAISAHAASAPVKVVASFSVLGDLVKQVGADRIAVTTLVGPDGDAHTFEPSPADAKAIAGADLVVENGLGLEKWLGRLIRAAGYQGPVAVASTGVTTHSMAEEGATVVDPHAWQDLANGRLYVENIRAALDQADPADAATFDANATAYEASLTELDGWVRGEIGGVPEAKRKVITSHDAFGYFGRAYGVTFLAPVGVSTEAEPSAADVAKLIRQIKSQHIKALFIENMSDPRLIAQLAHDGGAYVGGTLYSDALSRPGEGADTYVGMFRNNVPKLKEGMLRN